MQDAERPARVALTPADKAAPIAQGSRCEGPLWPASHAGLTGEPSPGSPVPYELDQHDPPALNTHTGTGALRL
jgi:hypothetical protein